MVATPRLVQLIAKLDSDNVRDERPGYENRPRTVRNVSDEVDRQLISPSMYVRAVRPHPDKDIRIEGEMVEGFVGIAHRSTLP